MLNAAKMITLFEELNEELGKKGEMGEIGIVGGAVMCLVFNARQSTRDVDAIFEPTKLIRKLVAEIGERNHLPQDWLNDAVKGYIQGEFQRNDILNLSHLRVWAPDARYMLTMKCISARWDSHDRDDVHFLIQFLKLKTAKAIYKIIQNYYPKSRIPPKTQFLIEELMENVK